MLIQEEVKEIYVWEDVQEWQPTANTLAYYKLDGNLNDSSGKGVGTLSNYGTTTTTLDSGKVVRYFDGSSYAYVNTTIMTGNPAFTVSLRYKYVSGVVVWQIGGIGLTSAGTLLGLLVDGGKYGIWKYQSDTATSIAPSGSWENVVITSTGSTTKVYINGVEKYSGSITYNIQKPGISFGRNNRDGANYSKGYMSEWILENKARTEQEISDYYNLTKSQYGL